jgi:hypothetical protein
MLAAPWVHAYSLLVSAHLFIVASKLHARHGLPLIIPLNDVTSALPAFPSSPSVHHHCLSFAPTSSPFFHFVLSLSSSRSAVSAGISTRTRMMACFRDLHLVHSVVQEVNYLSERGAVVRQAPSYLLTMSLLRKCQMLEHSTRQCFSVLERLPRNASTSSRWRISKHSR